MGYSRRTSTLIIHIVSEMFSEKLPGAVPYLKKQVKKKRAWWCMPLILALRRQRQVGLCEFKASLVYRVSSRKARATCLKKTKTQNKTKQNKKTRCLYLLVREIIQRRNSEALSCFVRNINMGPVHKSGDLRETC